MSEPCPECGNELTVIDVNPELSLSQRPKSGLYEYRHKVDDGRCSLAYIIPSVTHVRCWECCRWIPGRRREGALICLDCIKKGYDYDSLDLRGGIEGDSTPWL